jgi:hypothetical protein
VTGVAILLALAAGTSLGAVAVSGKRSDITVGELWALGGVLGVACLTSFVAVGAAVGVSIWLSCLLFAVCSALLATILRRSSVVSTLPAPRTVAQALPQRLLFWAAIAIFAAKVLHFPLWSWDYYAIWGVKARRLIASGAIDYSFLRTASFDTSNPQYPVGAPLSAQLLFLGNDVGSHSWKALHIVACVALLLVVRATIRVAGDREAGENIWAAYAAITPLFWDTEAVGLVDAPLALVAAAAVFFIVRDSAEIRSFDLLPIGVCVGFLPWLKDEGLTLAGYLILATLVVFPPARRRWRSWIIFCCVVGAFLGSFVAVRLCCLGAGTSFFAGHWAARFGSRVHHPMEVFIPLLSDLAGWTWWGCWLIFLGVLGLAAKRRSIVSLAISGVVISQLLTYVAVYFATYLTPSDHIVSSFHRIAAALSPMAIGDHRSRMDAGSNTSV